MIPTLIYWKPWRVYAAPLRPGLSKIVEIHDARGRAVLPWGAFDHLEFYSQKLRLAKQIVKAVNAVNAD